MTAAAFKIHEQLANVGGQPVYLLNIGEHCGIYVPASDVADDENVLADARRNLCAIAMSFFDMDDDTEIEGATLEEVQQSIMDCIVEESDLNAIRAAKAKRERKKVARVSHA